MEYAVFEDGNLRDSDGREWPWPELAVLGDPVAHSLSPALHAAALAARNIDARYEAIRVAAPDLAPALDAALTAGVRGINLTLPLKTAALAQAGRVTDECRRIGATNTMVARAGVWMAHNTDARGLSMALERALGPALGRQLGRCLVLGAGGVARAAVVALEALGAARIEVGARDVGRADWATAFGAVAVELSAAKLEEVSLLVNCTPVGMADGDPSPVDTARLGGDTYVMDTTYGDRPSALLSSFAGQGQDGRAMLVAQAALAFSVWYGAIPPLEEMAAAIGVDW